MAYVSLYRKYRPHTFSDVVGQKHVVETLQNAIREDRLHHAYLFTGPRGTGKTSIARILAMAVNAEGGPTPDPDPDDPISESIREGNAVDVIELDMASHGGVDDARELRDRALFAPAQLRKKVYILDEVHMASQAAFNALLKLIEEPPGHVLFAMATTDPQKVIPTIMSRVQRLDLRRVQAPLVADHVRTIAGHEGFIIEDDALDLVVRAGDGSVRDTLSVLEQVLAFSGERITGDRVAQVLGHTPVERSFDAVEHLADLDLGALLGLVQGLLDEGHDLRRFTLDLLRHLRDLMVLQTVPDRPDLIDATDEHRTRLSDQIGRLSQESLARAIDLLSATLSDQRTGPARLPLELAFAKLALPGSAGDVGALADRIARIEQGGVTVAASTPTAGESAPRSQAGDLSARAAARAAANSAAGTETPAEDESPADPQVSADVRTPADTQTPPDPEVPADTEAPTNVPTDASTGGSTPAGEDASAAEDEEAPVVHDDAAPTAEQAEADETVAGDAAVADEAAAGDDDAAADDFERLRERWPAVLETVKENSKRIHAVYDVAEPIRLRDRILTLEFPKRYAGFHADQATKADFVEVLRAAVERSIGVSVRVEAVVSGQDTRRRPRPPLVSSDGATDHDADAASGDVPPEPDDAGPVEEDEGAAVREAEMAPTPPTDPDEATERATMLLQDHLDAEPVDEEL